MQKFVFDNKLDKRNILNVDNHVGMPPTPIEISITASRAFVCTDGVGYVGSGVVGGGPRVNGNVNLRETTLAGTTPHFGGASKGRVCFIDWTKYNDNHGYVWVIPFDQLGNKDINYNYRSGFPIGFVKNLSLSNHRYSVILVANWYLITYVGGRWIHTNLDVDTAISSATRIVIRKGNTIRVLSREMVPGVAATFNGTVGTLGALVYVNKQLIVADTTSFWVSDSLQGVSHPTFSTNIPIGYTILDIKQAGSHIVVVTADGLFLFRQSGTEWVFVWSVSTTTGFVSIVDLGQNGYDNDHLAVGNFINNTLSIWESGYNVPYGGIPLTGTTIALTNGNGVSKITAINGDEIVITLPKHGTWVYVEITGFPSRLTFNEWQINDVVEEVSILKMLPEPDSRFTFVRMTTTANSTWFLAGAAGIGDTY